MGSKIGNYWINRQLYRLKQQRMMKQINKVSNAGIEEREGEMAAPYLKRLVAGFPLRWHGFKPGSSHVGFVVDKVGLEQVFSEYFGFPCQSSFHYFSTITLTYHPGLAQYNRPVVAAVPEVPPHKLK
jgi:hypothetical protein